MLLREQKAAAEALGVTPRGLRDWMKEPGFPDCSAGYDLEAIADWQAARAKKGSAEGEQARKLKLAITAQKLRQEKAKADAAERSEEEAKNNILRRDEWELFAREAIQMARDRLMLLPQDLCKIVPQQYHRRIIEDGKQVVARILDEFARTLDRGPRD